MEEKLTRLRAADRIRKHERTTQLAVHDVPEVMVQDLAEDGAYLLALFKSGKFKK